MVQNKKSTTGGEYGTNTNIWRLKNMLLKTNESMKKSKRESENTLRLINTNFPKSIVFSKSSSRGKFIVTDASLKEKKMK